MRITNSEQYVWDFGDGPQKIYSSTIEYAEGDQVPGFCLWLVPDLSDGVPDAVLCEALIHGPKCAVGHVQVGEVAALNEPPELN
jgi:hypothetical protein